MDDLTVLVQNPYFRFMMKSILPNVRFIFYINIDQILIVHDAVEQTISFQLKLINYLELAKVANV